MNQIIQSENITHSVINDLIDKSAQLLHLNGIYRQAPLYARVQTVSLLRSILSCNIGRVDQTMDISSEIQEQNIPKPRIDSFQVNVLKVKHTDLVECSLNMSVQEETLTAKERDPKHSIKPSEPNQIYQIPQEPLTEQQILLNQKHDEFRKRIKADRLNQKQKPPTQPLNRKYRNKESMIAFNDLSMTFDYNGKFLKKKEKLNLTSNFMTPINYQLIDDSQLDEASQMHSKRQSVLSLKDKFKAMICNSKQFTIDFLEHIKVPKLHDEEFKKKITLLAEQAEDKNIKPNQGIQLAQFVKGDNNPHPTNTLRQINAIRNPPRTANPLKQIEQTQQSKPRTQSQHNSQNYRKTQTIFPYFPNIAYPVLYSQMNPIPPSRSTRSRQNKSQGNRQFIIGHQTPIYKFEKGDYVKAQNQTLVDLLLQDQ